MRSKYTSLTCTQMVPPSSLRPFLQSQRNQWSHPKTARFHWSTPCMTPASMHRVKRPPGHSEIEMRGPQKPWWNDVKVSSTFSMIHMKGKALLWLLQMLHQPATSTKETKQMKRGPNPFSSLWSASNKPLRDSSAP